MYLGLDGRDVLLHSLQQVPALAQVIKVQRRLLQSSGGGLEQLVQPT